MPPVAQQLIIERSHPGERLDIWLRSKLPALSRGAIQRLIEEGHVRVNGKVVKSTHTPRAGERIEVEFPEPKQAEAQPEDIPLAVLFEDEALVVVNKPAVLGVHPAAGHEARPPVNALRHQCWGPVRRDVRASR